MRLKQVKTLTDIKKGDIIIIRTAACLAEAIKVKMVKVSESDGTEIILTRSTNRFFNLGMYLEGKSWVRDVAVVEVDSDEPRHLMVHDLETNTHHELISMDVREDEVVLFSENHGYTQNKVNAVKIYYR